MLISLALSLTLQTVQEETLRAELTTAESAVIASNEGIYKIHIPADRYDMLCVEGISRALNVFGGAPSPTYTVADMTGELNCQSVTAHTLP